MPEVNIKSDQSQSNIEQEIQVLAGGPAIPVEYMSAVDESMTGNGTYISPLGIKTGGVAVVTDGTTIAGDGTTGDPLHAVAGGTPGGNQFNIVNGSGGPLLAGMPLLTAGVGNVTSAQANGLANSNVVALATANSANGATFLAQSAGALVLTTAQWDAIVTGGSGGLTSGRWYYLDAATPGFITLTPPSAGGTALVGIGQATSTTTLVLNIQKAQGPQ